MEYNPAEILEVKVKLGIALIKNPAVGIGNAIADLLRSKPEYGSWIVCEKLEKKLYGLLLIDGEVVVENLKWRRFGGSTREYLAAVDKMSPITYHVKLSEKLPAAYRGEIFTMLEKTAQSVDKLPAGKQKYAHQKEGAD